MDVNYSKQKKLPGRKNSGQVIISILISIFNSNTSLIVFHLYIFFSSVYYSSFFNLIFYLENEWTEARVSWHAVPLHGQLGAALPLQKQTDPQQQFRSSAAVWHLPPLSRSRFCWFWAWKQQRHLVKVFVRPADCLSPENRLAGSKYPE